MIDWYPMEEAPKDGTLILVSVDNQTYTDLAKWDSVKNEWLTARSFDIPQSELKLSGWRNLPKHPEL